jgi:arylsulfatase A-like enzyme
VGIEVSGHAALYRGDYKLVRTPAPLGDGAWRLYDVARDPGETRDLAAQMPELAAAMRADYDAYAARVGVLALPEGYDVQRQVAHNARMKQLEHYWWALTLAALALIALAALLVLSARRLMRRKSAAP